MNPVRAQWSAPSLCFVIVDCAVMVHSQGSGTRGCPAMHGGVSVFRARVTRPPHTEWACHVNYSEPFIRMTKIKLPCETVKQLGLVRHWLAFLCGLINVLEHRCLDQVCFCPASFTLFADWITIACLITLHMIYVLCSSAWTSPVAHGCTRVRGWAWSYILSAGDTVHEPEPKFLPQSKHEKEFW